MEHNRRGSGEGIRPGEDGGTLFVAKRIQNGAELRQTKHRWGQKKDYRKTRELGGTGGKLNENDLTLTATSHRSL